MDKEAINIIKDHKNPVTKLSLTGSKLFLKDSNPSTQQLITNNLNNLKTVLEHQKVEKRCSRAKAQWQPELNLAKVDKVVKGLLEHFGYQDKNGIYMYPEEMLFLIETNRMEMIINDVSLSIQECYDIVLNTPGMDLNKYKVYKKLILQGYRVIRFDEIIRRNNNNNNNNKKRKIESTNNSNPDYYLFLSNNNHRLNWDYNLYICKNYILDDLKSDYPSIYAICSGDNISLYKIGTVNLPSNIV